MAKASQKSSAAAPVSLGTKRSCPKCATKFYDFNKAELTCPKCESSFNASDLAVTPKLPEPKKAPKKAPPEEALMEAEDIVVGDGGSEFESLEDLDDEEDEVVEDLAVDDEDGQEN